MKLTYKWLVSERCIVFRRFHEKERPVRKDSIFQNFNSFDFFPVVFLRWNSWIRENPFFELLILSIWLEIRVNFVKCVGIWPSFAITHTANSNCPQSNTCDTNSNAFTLMSIQHSTFQMCEKIPLILDRHMSIVLNLDDTCSTYFYILWVPLSNLCHECWHLLHHPHRKVPFFYSKGPFGWILFHLICWLMLKIAISTQKKGHFLGFDTL